LAVRLGLCRRAATSAENPSSFTENYRFVRKAARQGKPPVRRRRRAVKSAPDGRCTRRWASLASPNGSKLRALDRPWSGFADACAVAADQTALSAGCTVERRELEVVVTDWSDGHYGGGGPVGVAGGIDPWASTWAGPVPTPTTPAPGAWGAQQPSTGGWAAPPQRAAAGGWQQAPVAGPSAGYGQPSGWLNPASRPNAPKNRKPLFITLAVGCAVIVIVAIAFVITVAGGGSGSDGSAGAAVKGYLEALARGDAEAALAYSNDLPASKEFLTNEILRKQIAQWPITNIRILRDDSLNAIGYATVHVAANFGDKVSDTNLEVKKDHGHWKITMAAIKLTASPSASSNAAAKTLTLFGKPIGDATAYVFPGWTDIGSTNPYISATAKPMLLDQLSSSGRWLDTTFALSDAGRDAANAQLAAAMSNCQKSNLLAPPGCPVHLNPSGLVDGTAEWGPADLSEVKMDSFDPYRVQLRFFGEVKVPIMVRTTNSTTKTGTVTKFLSGTADMTITPPELTFR
jgi:hypothetical protein